MSFPQDYESFCAKCGAGPGWCDCYNQVDLGPTTATLKCPDCGQPWTSIVGQPKHACEKPPLVVQPPPPPVKPDPILEKVYPRVSFSSCYICAHPKRDAYPLRSGGQPVCAPCIAAHLLGS